MWWLKKEARASVLDGIQRTPFVCKVYSLGTLYGTPYALVVRQVTQLVLQIAMDVNLTSPGHTLVVEHSLFPYQKMEKMLSHIPESKEVRHEVPPLKRPWWFRSTGESSSTERYVNLVLLAHPGPRTGGEFCSSISNNDYSYFSGLLDETRRGKLFELVDHICHASVVLTFAVTGQKRFPCLLIFVKKECYSFWIGCIIQNNMA